MPFSSRQKTRDRNRSPQFGNGAVWAFVPALMLVTYWFGGETALLIIAVCLPVLALLFGAILHPQRVRSIFRKPPDTPIDMIVDHLDIGLEKLATTHENSAAFVVEIDHIRDVQDRHGADVVDAIVAKSIDRLAGVVRTQDTVKRTGQNEIAIAVSPKRRFDLESAIQMAGRMQAAFDEPMSINAGQMYVSVSIGFCLSSQNPKSTGRDLFDAAGRALTEARRNGPSAIRAFTSDMEKHVAARTSLIENVEMALEQGQIRAWFQPQISTDTGKITGFESLARWVHPTNGIIPPNEFLDAIEEAGLMGRLGELMLYNALSALKSWDEQGFDIPTVGVNFSAHELRDPKLVRKIEWELDRFSLDASRLSVEVLETVVAASPDDVVSRNIAQLSNLGCQIDLDDFGTGHASITNIRRLSVDRIKIDRSFVMKVDKDHDQQRMVSAILTMSEQLGLDTLAEGVETIGEHAMLAQLGCGHVQGFGLGRPMPLEETPAWIRSHQNKTRNLPTVSKKVG